MEMKMKMEMKTWFRLRSLIQKWRFPGTYPPPGEVGYSRIGEYKGEPNYGTT